MSRHWNAENRKLLKEGKIKGFFAGPDESFPIAGPEDITHAFETLHYAKPSEQGEIRARILDGAKQHGWESALPADEVAKAMTGTTGMAGGARTPQAAAYNSARIQAEAHAHAAHNASRAAVTTSTPEAHAAAAQAHNVAAQSHFTARTKAAAAGDQGAIAKHNQAMMQHNQQKAYHTSMQGGGEGGVRPAWNHQAVAKSEAEPPEAMTPEEVLKAQVHAHTRHMKSGKVVHVHEYSTAKKAAMKASAAAISHASKALITQAKSPDASWKAAKSAKEAAEAHRNAARMAPTDEDRKSHENAAALHDKAFKTHIHRTAELHGENRGDQFIKGIDKKDSKEERANHLRDEHESLDFYTNEIPEFLADSIDEPETGTVEGVAINSYSKKLSKHHAELTGKELHWDPKKKRTIAKAQVHAHTRHLKSGKAVQVRDYQTARQVAHQNSAKAHEASGASTVNHQAAAAAHRHAAQAHLAAEQLGHQTEAAVHRTMATMHNQSAQLHESLIPQKGADTGGDGQHMPEHLQDLENHPDYAGFGYLGHSNRTPATDKALVEAANKHGLSKHELAALVLGRAGRYIGDTLSAPAVKQHGEDTYSKLNSASESGKISDEDYSAELRKLQDAVPHEKMVEHLHHEIAFHTTGKGAKHSGVKEYAKDLADREAEAKGGKKK